ncbi:hypothetical protein EXIGLDRAFT_828824 [Exidia glandulosa HHB12029]|uniref:Thioesterase/thiol ester dehydrase-isomerase n=1 Tax=Exidia glandulosa HHB12029 TaxID=1314781 RepID=A0A165Q4K8_EXIGL|nr:hypothetical protein EXIGLDRAFT_828824 [Exidia glandulosa HHB12029]
MLLAVAALLVGAVFLLHYRSWPFYWHLRMLYPFLSYPVSFLLRSGSKRKWMDSVSAKGQSPFEVYTVWRGWAGPDDCDYNMHLSNSSYAKNFDYARSDYIAKYFLPFGLDGGAPALAQSQFYYVREIPIGKRYEIRTSLAGWDDKRIHFIARFISHKTAADKKREARSRSSAPPSGTSTPANTAEPVTSRPAVPFISDPRISDAEYTTHAICIASYVLKHSYSRRNISPALVLAASGFGGGNAWERMQDIRYGKDSKALKKFWSGGWAELGEGERWWDELAQGWEAQRAKAVNELR